MRMVSLLLLTVLTGTSLAQTQKGVVGFWREPQGSVIEVYACGGADVCIRIEAVRKDVPQVDANNPDETLRTRPICGLQIGRGFHLTDALHAEAGKLYDPKSGNTYDGDLTAEGDALHLRGYLKLKAFGRSETWARTTAATCAENH